MVSRGFGFGIEAEFLLVDESGCPLWLEDLQCEDLLDLVDDIYTRDIPYLGLNHKPLHKRLGHYLIEGYTLTDGAMKPQKLLPKGIEVRTPICGTIDEAVDYLRVLQERLASKLAQRGMGMSIISHHPGKHLFDAPRNYERDDYWQWARVATATFGPDFNISLPDELSDRYKKEAARRDFEERLARRVDYFMPSVVALTLASPFFDGRPWQPHTASSEGHAAQRAGLEHVVGKSIRTFRRSLYAPSHYVHHEPSWRFEFKGFEMAVGLGDYRADFLLSLAILLSEKLDAIVERSNDKRFINASRALSESERARDGFTARVRSLRSVAVSGLEEDEIRSRATVVIDEAEKVALQYGLGSRSIKALDTMRQRVLTGRVPADDMLAEYHACGDINQVLRNRSGFSDELATVAQPLPILTPAQLALTSQAPAPLPVLTPASLA